MPALSDDKIEKTAREVVDCWDMDTLLSFAIENMIMFYNEPENEEALLNDYEEYVPRASYPKEGE